MNAVLSTILALIGAGATIYAAIAGIIKLIKKYRHKKTLKQREFGIDGLWKAYYNENKKSKTEEVKIETNGQNVKATIASREDKQKYTFKGTYVNRRLQGSFDEDSNSLIESGTLALSYANDGLLYGNCTLVDEKGRNINYPYALMTKSKVDESSYSFCKECHQQQTCCCNSKCVDAPILIPNEMDAFICIKNCRDKSKIAEQHKELWQIKKNKDNACKYNNEKGCSIHNIRPNDCRLFPFDVIKESNNYRIILYKKDACPFSPTSIEVINNCKKQVEKLIKLIAPYIDDWTDEKFMRHLKKQEYTPLGEVDVTDFTNPLIRWYEQTSQPLN